MVYCTKCGTKNADDAKVCAQCGASLYAIGESESYRRIERECFGLPRGGAIVGAAIGIIILLSGLLILLQQADVIPENVNTWPFILIIFGVLVVVGAIYGLSRRR